MSGFGERFRRAGYSVPKPLIEIEGKPIIAHVIDMFPGETDFIFICSEDHLDHPEYHMEETLQRFCPTGRIIGIPPHKLGPVYAVLQVEHLIDPQRPVVVNYCDFTCYWDWHHFKDFVACTACAGAIPAYKGFHPHSLGSTNYAYMREEGGWVLAIQEKQPYTNNRMEEYASSGTYYFASGALMRDAFRGALDQELKTGDEFYVSLTYRPMLARQQPVAVYPLQHFMQWGTPEDVAEYEDWSAVYRCLIAANQASTATRGAVIVPMAGLGRRFAKEGYSLTKPLIPVSGKPMVVQAVHDLPAANHHVFVLRRDMVGYQETVDALRREYPSAILEVLPDVTDGQACTALAGLDVLERSIGDVYGPVTFGACDNGALYDVSRLNQLLDDPTVDVIVWGVRGYANAARHPHMYGWIDSGEDRIRRISVKSPLGAPDRDPIVLGTFTFRRTDDFRRAVGRLIDRDGRVNGEFYIDSCINDAIELGLRCVLFEVDHFLCWGTPNDLRTFEYWQSCFDKWPSHPYSIEDDRRIAPGAVTVLRERYRAKVPPFPRPF